MKNIEEILEIRDYRNLACFNFIFGITEDFLLNYDFDSGYYLKLKNVIHINYDSSFVL